MIKTIKYGSFVFFLFAGLFLSSSWTAENKSPLVPDKNARNQIIGIMNMAIKASSSSDRLPKLKEIAKSMSATQWNISALDKDLTELITSNYYQSIEEQRISLFLNLVIDWLSSEKITALSIVKIPELGLAGQMSEILIDNPTGKIPIVTIGDQRVSVPVLSLRRILFINPPNISDKPDLPIKISVDKNIFGPFSYRILSYKVSNIGKAKKIIKVQGLKNLISSQIPFIYAFPKKDKLPEYTAVISKGEEDANGAYLWDIPATEISGINVLPYYSWPLLKAFLEFSKKNHKSASIIDKMVLTASAPGDTLTTPQKPPCPLPSSSSPINIIPGVKYCGPDATSQYLSALNRVIHKMDEKGLRKKGRVYGLYWLLTHGARIDFILNDHDDDSGSCPTVPPCADTVTLAGHCIRNGAMSNIMYGMIGTLIGVTGQDLVLGGHAAEFAHVLETKQDGVTPKHVGLDPPGDQAGYAAGMALASNLDVFADITSGDLQKVIEQTEFSKWFGLDSNSVLKLLTDPGKEECVICPIPMGKPNSDFSSNDSLWN